METSDQPKQAASNDPEEVEPAFYFLQAAEAGEVAGQGQLNQVASVKALFAQYQPSIDLEYPSARSIIENPDQFRVGQVSTGLTGESDPRRSSFKPETGDGSALHGRNSAFAFPSSLAGSACGFCALAVLLIGGAIAGRDWALLGGAIALFLFSAFVLSAVVRASRGMRRGSERDFAPPRPAIWGLENGRGWQEAVKIGLRTAGLGLLVEPTNRESTRRGDTDR